MFKFEMILMPADHRRRHRRLDEQDVLKLAVDPEPHPQAAFLRIEMDVGRLAVARAFQDLVDQLRERGRLSLFLKLLAHVAVMLRAVRRKRRRRGRDAGTRSARARRYRSPARSSRSNASWLSTSGEIRLSSRIDCRKSRLCSSQ